MRVGVITDVHNNAAALDVALGALRRAGCGRILCCGDIIGIGPRPEETVRRLARLPGLVAVRGNHERYLLEGMPDAVPNDQGMGRDEMEHHRWEHSRLSAQSISFLRALPCRADIELGGLRVAVMHYAMSGGRYLDLAPQPGPDDCRRMFAEVDADVVLYGHDHFASIVRDGGRLYANFGSLGCPGRAGAARAGVLDIRCGRANAEMIELRYDAGAVAADILRLAYPASDEIARIFYGRTGG